MTVKVSVIIPSYNRAGDLPRALESLLSQTKPDWECIIVDDGSTDETRQVVAGFERIDSRFRYHYQNNGGASKARNRGIALASGEWVMFLDSDDYLLPWAIECYDRAAAAFPDAPVVVARMVKEKERVKPPDYSRLHPNYTDYLPSPEGKSSHFCIHSVAVRRSLLRSMRCFDETFLTGEDTDFLLRLRSVGKLAEVAWPVAVICQSADGKYARNIASGERLEAELRMHRRYPDESFVRGQLSGSSGRYEQVVRYCRIRVSMLETVRFLRDERYAEAAREFHTHWMVRGDAEETRFHASRWYDHLFYPSNRPCQAALQFGGRVGKLASTLDSMAAPDAADFVRRQLLACLLYQAGHHFRQRRCFTGCMLVVVGLVYCRRPGLLGSLVLDRCRQASVKGPRLTSCGR